MLAERSGAHRARLRAVACQMPGPASEAASAVREAWLRLSRADPGSIVDPGGWLTAAVGRVCLNMLASRRDEPAGMHDMSAVPFGDIAAVAGRPPAAARQLASRARRRVQDAAPVPGTGLTRQRAVAGAFPAAARNGDSDALPEAPDPDVTVRSDGAGVLRGAAAVAGRAFPFTRIARVTLPALINGAAGAVTAADGRPVTLIAFTITGAKIVAIDLTDAPSRIAEADLAILGR